MNLPSATRAGTVRIGEITVPRLGFGTMQLSGPGALGPARDKQGALAVLRRAVDLGIRVLDTAGYYGPDVANELLAEALHPYPDELVIASKVGARRVGTKFAPADTAEEIRAAVEHDLTVLKLDTLDLVHVRRMPDSTTPYLESIAALAQLRERGLVRHVGVSNVTAELFHAARDITPIASIENEFNLRDRDSDLLVDIAAEKNIPFLPFHPLGLGQLTNGIGALADISHDLTATHAQIALAWLLHRAPTILPIPGTTSIAHLEENLGAIEIDLTQEHLDRLAEMP